MRIGKARAAEIGHGIGLAPYDVVQHPEAQILQHGADPEYIVIGADDPHGAVGLEQASGRAHPGAGEFIVMGKAVELVPVVIHRIDLGLVGAGETLLELQVIWRICENQIDGAGRQTIHVVDAIAHKDSVDRQARGLPFRIGLFGRTRGTQHALNPNAVLTRPL